MVKPSNGEPVTFRSDELNKKWKTKRSDDSAVVKGIIEELDKYDILCAHNGLKYDLPFLRTRAAHWGQPPLRNPKLIDPVLIARRNLKMSYNGLERIADFLGCNTKTKLSGDLWVRASMDGDTEAMNYIVEHCIQDVLMLETIVETVKGYCPAFNSKGSWV